MISCELQVDNRWRFMLYYYVLCMHKAQFTEVEV